MSDISNSNNSSSSKRRLSQIDDNIEYLTREINMLNDFVYKLDFECSLMTVKIKREKVKAVSAIAKSHELLAKMEVSLSESALFTEVERLRNRNFNKKIKLDRNEGKSQVTPAPTTSTVSVQTIETMSNKKKKTRHSSSRSPVDISSDKTVIIPTIHESSASLVETTSHTSPTRFLGLFKKTPANKSDSEVLLSSSNKAEFHELYTKTQTKGTVTKPPTKKQKFEQKFESKSKSNHISKRTQSPTASPKMVADLRNSVNTASNHIISSSPAVSTQNSSTGEQNPIACPSYVPFGKNMGLLLTQPSTSAMHAFLHVIPATQVNIQYHTQ